MMKLADFVIGLYFTYPGGQRERFSQLWRQPLYVDERDGILKRTDRLPEEKARRRARRNPPLRPVNCVALAADRELRCIEGFWYELHLTPMPDPVYRAFAECRKVPLKPFHPRSPLVEIEITVRCLIGPSLRDAATGRPVEVGPEIDEPRAWSEYRRRHPDRRYAVAKRRLGKAELRRHGLSGHAPEDGPLGATNPPDRPAPFSRR